MDCRRYGGIMIELARRRMMMGSSTKPYDAEVEWISSDGNTVVDTLIYPNQSLGIVMDCICPDNPDINIWLFGARQANGVNQYALFNSPNDQKSQYRFGSSNIPGPGLSGRVQLIKNENSSNLYAVQDGTVYTYPVNSQTFTVPYTLWLFYIHLSNPQTVTNINKNFKVISCQLRRGGNLIGDYIPVRKNGQGYLYDRVTADFLPNVGELMLYGPDKTA